MRSILPAPVSLPHIPETVGSTVRSVRGQQSGHRRHFRVLEFRRLTFGRLHCKTHSGRQATLGILLSLSDVDYAGVAVAGYVKIKLLNLSTT